MPDTTCPFADVNNVIQMRGTLEITGVMPPEKPRTARFDQRHDRSNPQGIREAVEPSAHRVLHDWDRVFSFKCITVVTD
jgi:hypothetical protein